MCSELKLCAVAQIFKHPESGNKGIVVFTHKEMNWLFPNTQSIKVVKNVIKHRSLNLSSLHSPKSRQEVYKKIRNSYFIGIHIGGTPSKIHPYSNCDFYMGGASVHPPPIPHQKKRIMKIPLPSRNFVPGVFSPTNAAKYWDILFISNSAKAKNADLFLQSIRNIFDSKINFKVLLVSWQHRDTRSDRIYHDLMNDYHQMFTFEERQNFHILRQSNEHSFCGHSPQVTSLIYNHSKIFTLFSQAEGASKAISEALCCGLPVVVKNDLAGGGLDYLDETNSMLFSSYDTAHETLIEAVKNHQKFTLDPIKIRKQLGEEHSIHALKTYFARLYSDHGQQFDGQLINTDNLNKRLPAHHLNVPWMRNIYNTADITTDKQLNIFVKNLMLS